jgi:hypothetical protein
VVGLSVQISFAVCPASAQSAAGRTVVSSCYNRRGRFPAVSGSSRPQP